LNNFRANHKNIFEVLRTITTKEAFFIQRLKPKLKGIELIAMNLTTEYMCIDIK